MKVKGEIGMALPETGVGARVGGFTGACVGGGVGGLTGACVGGRVGGLTGA